MDSEKCDGVLVSQLPRGGILSRVSACASYCNPRNCFKTLAEEAQVWYHHAVMSWDIPFCFYLFFFIFVFSFPFLLFALAYRCLSLRLFIII